jgi:hypothetical protein
MRNSTSDLHPLVCPVNAEISATMWYYVADTCITQKETTPSAVPLIQLSVDSLYTWILLKTRELLALVKHALHVFLLDSVEMEVHSTSTHSTLNVTLRCLSVRKKNCMVKSYLSQKRKLLLGIRSQYGMIENVQCMYIWANSRGNKL